MKLNKYFMFAMAGLAFAACSENETDSDNVLANGVGAVSVKIVAPTLSSTGRAVAEQTTGPTVTVTGDVTITLNADEGDGTITLKAADISKGATFWNVKGPRSITVSMNGGVADYSNVSITESYMQSVNNVAAYGSTSTITLKGSTSSPTGANNEVGATEADRSKKYEMYEASVALSIPVARLEVSGIAHVDHATVGTTCEYTALSIDGVYLDNIQPTGGNTARKDYRFPGDNSQTTTATGEDAILYNEITSPNNDFLATGATWPVDATLTTPVYGYNFYAAASSTSTYANNPVFKIYFANATGNGVEKSEPRYAMITKYKANDNDTEGIELLAGHVYQITKAVLDDKNIIGDEGGNTLYGVEVTVMEATWQVETITADWAE